eukprot:4787042-Pleurochrysis_carterae.AAC.3
MHETLAVYTPPLALPSVRFGLLCLDVRARCENAGDPEEATRKDSTAYARQSMREHRIQKGTFGTSYGVKLKIQQVITCEQSPELRTPWCAAEAGPAHRMKRSSWRRGPCHSCQIDAIHGIFCTSTR